MSELPNTRRVPAWAKLNLFLRVLRRREDGYHDLESVVVPISLGDTLEIHAASDPGHFRTLSFSFDVSGESRLVRGVPVDESNLVLRAAKALADRVGVRGFADLHLEKRIPPAAGLGGGSSDAAAALRALNDLWGAGLTPEQLIEVAAGIGSDLPAVLASGPVLVRGRGEAVTRLEVRPLRWALVTFDIGVSTRDAYGWWDEDGSASGLDPGPILEVLGGSGPAEVVGPLLFNDLEGPVVRRHPQVGRAKEMALAGGAAGAAMTGSGPTVAALLPSRVERLPRKAESDLERLSGRPITYVSSPGATRPR